MHICLLPTEILLEIFSTICDSEEYNPISRSTLTALARTCRTFKEPALHALWKHIDGLKPLVSCLPEGVSSRNMQGKLTLDRPLFTGEWQIFGQYANRIHSLSISPAQLDIIDDRVVQAFISSPSPAPLLPNLRSLHWYDDRECFIPLLRTLLGSTITSMVLEFTSSSFAKSALLASLGTRCPSIRKLGCVYGGDSVESSDAVCEAVCSLQQLFHLKTGALNTQALLHLASLPSLKSLDFGVHNIDETQPIAIPTFASQINEVCIGTPSLSVLTHSLRNIRFPSCQSVVLSIHCSYSEPPYNPLDIPELIVSFLECFSPTLEQFSVNFMPNLEVPEGTLADPRFVLVFDAVAPLLSLSRLTKLDLDWICTSGIDDASLKRIAQSLPQLEEFYFGSGTRWLVPPSLTFVGLTDLIQHCRRLRRIDMTFCACSVDTNSEPFSKTIPNEKMTSLFVGISPVVDPMAVACQLHTLLPKLTAVDTFSWPRNVRRTPPFLAFEEDWAMVDKFLEVLTTGAKMRENMGQGPQELSA